MNATTLSVRRFVPSVFTVAWWVAYVAAVAVGLVLAMLARRNLFEPYLGVSLALIVLVLAGWLVGPRQSLYVVLFLTAVSDRVTVAWFPFVKNFSSRESIAFIADGLTLSPLDAALALGTVVSVVRYYARHRRFIARSSMNWPVAVFMGFVAYGFANGVVGGAPLRIAIIESRPLLYIALAYVIAMNELHTPAHLRRAFWAIIAGVTVQSVLSIDFLRRLPEWEQSNLADLNEHGSTIGHGLVILALLAIAALGVGMAGRGWIIAVAAIPTVYVYAVAQRRAGFGALMLALVLLAVVLYWHRRVLFWTVVPTAALLLTAYTLAFWNSSGSIGFGAQAVKAIVAPGSGSMEDQTSDLYRLVEAYNLNFTIRTSPLRGRGFGHPFYQPVQLPEITDFELSAYIPHNSFLWVWVKLGFAGFVATFVMFGKALMSAAAGARVATRDSGLVVLVLAAGVVVMYATYTWYDISWDARNTVFLGLALAVCARAAVPAQAPDRTASTTAPTSSA